MRILLLATAAAVIAAPAMARTDKTVSGSVNGMTFEARSMIVGMTSTATAAAGGNPIYFANAPKYQGVVTLIMEYDGIGAFICTGSAVAKNKIVTAAHCVSDGFGTKGPDRVRAYFTDSADPDLIRFGAGFNPVAGVTAIDVNHIHVNPGYTGQVIDQNDIAVLSLSAAIPDYAPIYKFSWDDPEGMQFNVVGNGARSTVGGALGANAGTGRMRQGDNIYDFRWGNAAFEDFFTGTNFWGTADYAYSYISDFDSGRPANDVGCALTAFFPLAPASFCQLGVGALEVGVAGGDSGGPSFINGRIAAVTSYGAKFGIPNTDVDGPLNSSWGEMSGYVPIFIHRDWLGSVVPEPATWAMMIAGFGLVGAAARRRNRAVIQ